jgi:hypothetical protein
MGAGRKTVVACAIVATCFGCGRSGLDAGDAPAAATISRLATISRRAIAARARQTQWVTEFHLHFSTPCAGAAQLSDQETKLSRP